MRANRRLGIASCLMLLATGTAAAATNPQAPDAPAVWLADRSDRVIDVGGCALSCFDLVYSHTTPAYYSFDTPRSVTLVYNSRTAYPRPFVLVDAQAAATGSLPDMLSIELRVWHGSSFGWVSYPPLDGPAPIYYRYADASRPVARMKFQFDGTGLGTGRFPVQVEVRAWCGGVSSVPVLVSGYVLVVNELSSPFGAGWNMAGLQRIYVSGNDAVITEGDGSAVHFQRACPTCAWVAPDGEFSTLTSPGFGYYRNYPDGTEAFFTDNGSISWIRDRHSNITFPN